MGCIFGIFAGFFPRLALLLVWILTPLVTRAFDHVVWPILGIIFLPLTTLVYVLVYSPRNGGVAWWGWVLVAIAVLFDLNSYNASRHRKRKSQ